MNLTRRQLAEVIADRTMHIADRAELGREIAAYLMSEHRTDDVGTLLREVMQIRAEHGFVEATAVSAHPLDAEVIEDIKRTLSEYYPKATHIIVHESIDPTVVGGVRIELAQAQLDYSVKAKLNTFKRLTAQERN